MELWIRSQDKTKLEQVFSLCTFEISDGKETKYVIENSDSYLGEYKSKERALEVLDDIESVMKTNCGFELYSRTGVYPNEFNKKWNCVPVYTMPKE